MAKGSRCLAAASYPAKVQGDGVEPRGVKGLGRSQEEAISMASAEAMGEYGGRADVIRVPSRKSPQIAAVTAQREADWVADGAARIGGERGQYREDRLDVFVAQG